MRAEALFLICIGVLLLLGGRKLFWFFLGAVGFVVGFEFARRFPYVHIRHLPLIVGVVAGIFTAGLAVFIQKIAVAAAGFLAGGYLVTALVREFGLHTGQYHWIVFVVAGIVGAILMRLLFGWTLIVFSAVMGAGIIINAFPLSANLSRIVFFFLLISGVAVQSGLARKAMARSE